jgi:hypothetical protein
MGQFVDLWLQISQVRLTSEEDSISWRFTPDGCYTAESAYNVQFQGAIRDGPWNTVWKAKVETKCRFFIWLLLQEKLPTADRISDHGGPANISCSLCYTNAESHLHMVVRCSDSRAVWQHIATHFSFPQLPQQSRTLRRWWRLVLNQGSADRDNHLQVIIYTLWNIWKERCKRVFQQIGINADQVAALSRQDVLTYRVGNSTVV